MSFVSRIGDNYLRGDKISGEILTSDDYNKNELIIKEAINANYYDIQVLEQKIKNLSVNTPEGDDSTNSSLPLVYYWNGENTQKAVDTFNEVCRLYDQNIPFILLGRFEVEDGWWYPEGVWNSRPREYVVPINVTNYTNDEENVDEGGNPIDATLYSFTSSPIRIALGYTVGSLMLVGEWGKFTAIEQMTWNYAEGPSQNLEKFPGFDRTKTQNLKNINGTFTWVDEV